MYIKTHGVSDSLVMVFMTFEKLIHPIGKYLLRENTVAYENIQSSEELRVGNRSLELDIS